MANDPLPTNSLASASRQRSTTQGDVPEMLQRRYYVDGKGGAGLGFYVDAKMHRPAFRDEGRRLATTRSDPNAIRDMLMIAQHRQWSMVTVRGDKDFRREAWVAGRALGVEVRGYRPTERDIQELDRRIDRRNTLAARAGRTPTDHGPPHLNARPKVPRREDQAARSRMKVVEAVVRGRVADPQTQDRILDHARERLATLLERGAKIAPLTVRYREPVVTDPRRERTRAR